MVMHAVNSKTSALAQICRESGQLSLEVWDENLPETPKLKMSWQDILSRECLRLRVGGYGPVAGASGGEAVLRLEMHGIEVRDVRGLQG